MHPAPRRPDGEGLQTPAPAAWDMRCLWWPGVTPPKYLDLRTWAMTSFLVPSGPCSLSVLESPYLTLDRVPVCLSGLTTGVVCEIVCFAASLFTGGVPLCGTAWWNKRSKCPSVHGSVSLTLPAQPGAGATCPQVTPAQVSIWPRTGAVCPCRQAARRGSDAGHSLSRLALATRKTCFLGDIVQCTPQGWAGRLPLA